MKKSEKPHIHIRIFPCIREEFNTIEELRKWLKGGELDSRGGFYRLRSIKGVKDVIPGSIVLFRFANKIVGDAVVKQDIKKLNETINGINYEGMIQFEPASIKVYKIPLPISFIETLTSRDLSVARTYFKIDDINIYEKVLRECEKNGFE